MSVPRVSVLMTTRNGATWIGESLRSVLTQEMSDLELVVVDDASSDETPAILAALSDPRVRVLRQDVQLGIAAGRNVGLAACRAPYVAVLDHDDLALPRRLGAQADYLDAHSGTVLVGTAVELLRAGRRGPSGQPRRTDPAGLRMLLHLGNALTWSSVMFRRAALDLVAEDGCVLRKALEPADDFDLYHRLMAHGDVARLDEVLTLYRWHAGNTTHTAAARIAAGAEAVLCRAYAPWFGDGSASAAALAVRHISTRAPARDPAGLDGVLRVIGRVAEGCGDSGRWARAMQWSVLRAAVRGGQPGMLRGRWRFAGQPTDTAVSAIVGSVRRMRAKLSP